MGGPSVCFLENFVPAYHEPGGTPDRLGPMKVQQMPRFWLAVARLLANRWSRRTGLIDPLSAAPRTAAGPRAPE